MSKNFTNHSKRLWSEEECRNILNAALLHLADKAGGQLTIDTTEMLKSADKMGSVAMTLSDDDKTLMISGMRTQ